MVNHLHAFDLFFFPDNRFRLPADVFPGKHGDLFQFLLRGWRLLILPKRPGLLHESSDLLVRKRGLIGGQPSGSLLIFLCGQILLRTDHQNCLKRIIQQIVTDQPLKIPLIHCLLQIIKSLLIGQMHRGISVVKPAVHALKTVHQPLRRRTVIRLTVTEFIEIQTSL